MFVVLRRASHGRWLAASEAAHMPPNRMACHERAQRVEWSTMREAERDVARPSRMVHHERAGRVVARRVEWSTMSEPGV
jgi:hypothetical protein